MSSIANISIRVVTSGDVVIDQVIDATENIKSPAFVYSQFFPANTPTAVYNPFNTHVGSPVNIGLIIGILIVPPQGNIHPYSLSPQPTPPYAMFHHPTNPMLLTMVGLVGSLYLHHENPDGLVIQFFWV